MVALKVVKVKKAIKAENLKNMKEVIYLIISLETVYKEDTEEERIVWTKQTTVYIRL